MIVTIITANSYYLYKSNEVYKLLKDYKEEFIDEYKFISAFKCALINNLDCVDEYGIEINKNENTANYYVDGYEYEITINDNKVISYKKY